MSLIFIFIVPIQILPNIKDLMSLHRNKPNILFRLEGHFIENIFFKGKWASEFQFAMLKREWANEVNPNL